MTLENTDKALASLIDAAHQLSTQLSPDVFNAAAQVAMLGVQGQLISAWIWTIAGTVIAIVLLFLAAMKSLDDTAGVVVGAFFVSVIIICWNISTLWNPLVNAGAHDGKIALANKVMEKIQ